MTPGDGTGTMPGNKGYTLLELLLTITIIALLTALAAQAYSESKRKAQIAACQTNNCPNAESGVAKKSTSKSS